MLSQWSTNRLDTDVKRPLPQQENTLRGLDFKPSLEVILWIATTPASGIMLVKRLPILLKLQMPPAPVRTTAADPLETLLYTQHRSNRP